MHTQPWPGQAVTVTMDCSSSHGTTQSYACAALNIENLTGAEKEAFYSGIEVFLSFNQT